MKSHHFVTVKAPNADRDTVTAEAALKMMAKQFCETLGEYRIGIVRTDDLGQVTLRYKFTSHEGELQESETVITGPSEEMRALVLFAHVFWGRGQVAEFAVLCGSDHPDVNPMTIKKGGDLPDVTTTVSLIRDITLLVKHDKDTVLMLRETSLDNIIYDLRPRDGDLDRIVMVFVSGRPAEILPVVLFIKLMAGDDRATDAFVGLCRARAKIEDVAKYVR